MTIAKFRALRRLWARVAEVVGEPDAGAARVHAVTSMPMMAERDPWVNMLRTTVAAFGAGVGGADTVLAQPFDAAVPAGSPASQRVSPAASPATRSCCCSRNPISAGCSTRPAARGSSRTSPNNSPKRPGSTSSRWRRRGIRRGARFRHRPDRRGSRPRIDDINHRRKALTGVNEYPNLGEPPLPQQRLGNAIARYAAGFEALRDRSDAHLAEDRIAAEGAVAAVGSARGAQHSGDVRHQSARIGGIEAVNPGTVGAAGGGRMPFRRRPPRHRR